VLADGPVGYWRLGETSGSTAVDVKGAANGTYEGGAALGVPGRTDDGDTAAGFDGVDDAVGLPDAFDFAGNAPFTIEFLLNRTTISEHRNRWVIAKGPPHSFPGSPARQGWTVVLYEELHSDPSLRNRIGIERWRDNAADITSSATRIEAGRWYHVAFTYDGATLRTYVNGTLENAGPSALALLDTASPLLFARWFPAEQYFGGVLDDVAVYTYALSGAQIAAHAGRAGPLG
jgi:hypothetical protein